MGTRYRRPERFLGHQLRLALEPVSLHSDLPASRLWLIYSLHRPTEKPTCTESVEAVDSAERVSRSTLSRSRMFESCETLNSSTAPSSTKCLSVWPSLCSGLSTLSRRQTSFLEICVYCDMEGYTNDTEPLAHMSRGICDASPSPQLPYAPALLSVSDPSDSTAFCAALWQCQRSPSQIDAHRMDKLLELNDATRVVRSTQIVVLGSFETRLTDTKSSPPLRLPGASPTRRARSSGPQSRPRLDRQEPGAICRVRVDRTLVYGRSSTI